QFRHTLRSKCRDGRLKSTNRQTEVCYHLAGVKIEGVSYVTPTVIPERGLRLVNPLIPAKSKRNPEARICMPRRASPCDSVPRGPLPGRVLARPFTSPARLNCLLRRTILPTASLKKSFLV